MTTTSFWDKAAAKYAKSPISDMDGYVETLDRIKAVLTVDHRVIELGCGTGSTAIELAGGVNSYLATDISAQMIAIATAKQRPKTPAQLSFKVGNAQDLAGAGVDIVLALNLLHLLRDMEQTIAAIFAALPSGGLFIAKTGLTAGAPWYVNLALPLLQSVGKAPYVRKLSRDGLATALTAAGFENVDTFVQGGDIVPRMFTIVRKP